MWFGDYGDDLDDLLNVDGFCYAECVVVFDEIGQCWDFLASTVDWGVRKSSSLDITYT